MTGPTSCRPCSHCPRHPYCILTRSSYPGQGRLAMIDRGRFVQRGSVLYRLGDPLQAVYVALDGAFKTVAISDEGEERIIGFHLPGEPIGLDAFGERRHRCDAVALTDAHICEVSFEMFTIQTSENARQLVRTLRTTSISPICLQEKVHRNGLRCSYTSCQRAFHLPAIAAHSFRCR